MKNLQRNSFAKQKETAIGLKIGKEETELDRHGDQWRRQDGFGD